MNLYGASFKTLENCFHPLGLDIFFRSKALIKSTIGVLGRTEPFNVNSPFGLHVMFVNCKQTVEDCRVRMNKPVELLVIENSLKAHSNEEEGLDECGVFAIPKYPLSQPQSANEELQSLTMCLQCKTTQIQSMFLPCHHIIHCESSAYSTLECPVVHSAAGSPLRLFEIFWIQIGRAHV